MHESKRAAPSRTPNKRGRRMALVLFAVGFGPLLLASMMYYTGWMNPAGTTNNGTLIKPAVPVAELGLVGPEGEPLEARFGPKVQDPAWLMLVAAADCQADCEQLIYLARQVNTALGKNQNRLERAAYLQQPPADLSEYPDMPLQESSASNPSMWPDNIDLQEAPRIYLVDPFGNVMMHYGPENTGKEMLEDLKQLMKLSQIG